MSEKKFRVTAEAVAAGVAALLLIGVIWSSSWAVGQSEQGVVLRMGGVHRVVPAGFHLTLPWPFETIQMVSTAEVRTMPVGYTMVARARGIEPTDDEQQWLTGDTNIIQMQTTVLYTVKDPAAYLFGVSDASDGRSRDFVIRKTCESVMTRHVAEMEVDDLLSSGKPALQRAVFEDAQKLLDEIGLGVLLTSVNIVDASPPKTVIDAFNDVSRAKSDRERRITEARGEANKTLPKARADANRKIKSAEIYQSKRVNRARGEAESFRKLEGEYQKAKEITRRRIWLDSMERILDNVEVTVVDESDVARRVFVEE